MGRAYHKSTLIGTDNPSSQYRPTLLSLGKCVRMQGNSPQGFICERTDPALIDMTKRFDIEIVPPFAPLLPNDNEIGLLQDLEMTRSPCL